MKTLIAGLVGLSLLVIPCFCFSEYILHLKDGGTIVTDRYWEEGDEIKFVRFGGVMGVSRDTVSSIEEVVPEPPVTDPDPEPVKAPSPPEEVAKEEKPERKSHLEAFYKKRDELKPKLDEALEQLREASRRRDDVAKQQARQDMRKYATALTELTEELKAANNGEVPEDWWQE